ncbi:hypothetical protein AB0I98_36830 [Streptomyces sp. NPDC050211]|uniref:hypothetical protein n=1 Tax=Streptomyces sp. NPDC050211 TaxID=3154932 RepID=UPI00342B87A5
MPSVLGLMEQREVRARQDLDTTIMCPSGTSPCVSANATSLHPGDLIFTEGSASWPEHVSMAIGDGLLVSAPKPGRVVEVAKISTHGIILVVRRIV